jgi:hypothetical protein
MRFSLKYDGNALMRLSISSKMQSLLGSDMSTQIRSKLPSTIHLSCIIAYKVARLYFSLQDNFIVFSVAEIRTYFNYVSMFVTSFWIICGD